MIERGIAGNLELPRADEGVTRCRYKEKDRGRNTSSTVKAAKRARSARAAAAASAQTRRRTPQLAAQNAAAERWRQTRGGRRAATAAATPRQATAQTAATGVSKRSTGKGSTPPGAGRPRAWSNAADYCTTTVAPKVSSALRTTARQVRPADTKSSKRPSMLTWSLLGAAILAALGAARAGPLPLPGGHGRRDGASRRGDGRIRQAGRGDAGGAGDPGVPGRGERDGQPERGEHVGHQDPRRARRRRARPPTTKPRGPETSVNGQVTAAGW